MTVEAILRDIVTYVIIEYSNTSMGTICDPLYEVLPYYGPRGHKQVALMIRTGGDAEIKPDLSLSFATEIMRRYAGHKSFPMGKPTLVRE